MQYIPLTINSQIMPSGNTAKCLGTTLDAEIQWKEHVKKKRTELDLKHTKKCIGYWKNLQSNHFVKTAFIETDGETGVVLWHPTVRFN